MCCVIKQTNISKKAFLNSFNTKERYRVNKSIKKFLNDTAKFSPWVVTSGLGVKVNLGYFLLRVESAWDKNPSGYSKPQWDLSLGPDW